MENKKFLILNCIQQKLKKTTKMVSLKFYDQGSLIMKVCYIYKSV